MMNYLSIACCLLLFSCSNKEQTAQDDAYRQSRETIVAKEEKNPLDFLKVTSADKKNVFGKTVVKGVIINEASIVSYQNVRIRLLSFRQTKMVEEHEDVISGMIPPGGQNKFTIRYRLPKGTDSLDISVMSAEVAPAKK